MKNTGKTIKSGGKHGQETRKDRKSATGMDGSPKKGGHGGKFTWSGLHMAGLHGFFKIILQPQLGFLVCFSVIAVFSLKAEGVNMKQLPLKKCCRLTKKA